MRQHARVSSIDFMQRKNEFLIFSLQSLSFELLKFLIDMLNKCAWMKALRPLLLAIVTAIALWRAMTNLNSKAAGDSNCALALAALRLSCPSGSSR